MVVSVETQGMSNARQCVSSLTETPISSLTETPICAAPPQVSAGDSSLSLLPPWHIYQRTAAYYLFSRCGWLLLGSVSCWALRIYMRLLSCATKNR
jgi:hypothetical protein